MAEELKQFKEEIINHFDKRTTELKEYFDEKTIEMKGYVDERAIETQRHFSVIDEALQHQIRQVAEGVSTNTRQINAMQGDITSIKDKAEEIDVRLIGVEDKVEGLGGKIDNLEKDMKIVKTDVGFIKSELSQKVSRQEFTFLENRVANLENNV